MLRYMAEKFAGHCQSILFNGHKTKKPQDLPCRSLKQDSPTKLEAVFSLLMAETIKREKTFESMDAIELAETLNQLQQKDVGKLSDTEQILLKIDMAIIKEQLEMIPVFPFQKKANGMIVVINYDDHEVNTHSQTSRKREVDSIKTRIWNYGETCSRHIWSKCRTQSNGKWRCVLASIGSTALNYQVRGLVLSPIGDLLKEIRGENLTLATTKINVRGKHPVDAGNSFHFPFVVGDGNSQQEYFLAKSSKERKAWIDAICGSIIKIYKESHQNIEEVEWWPKSVIEGFLFWRSTSTTKWYREQSTWEFTYCRLIKSKQTYALRIFAASQFSDALLIPRSRIQSLEWKDRRSKLKAKNGSNYEGFLTTSQLIISYRGENCVLQLATPFQRDMIELMNQLTRRDTTNIQKVKSELCFNKLTTNENEDNKPRNTSAVRDVESDMQVKEHEDEDISYSIADTSYKNYFDDERRSKIFNLNADIKSIPDNKKGFFVENTNSNQDKPMCMSFTLHHSKDESDEPNAIIDVNLELARLSQNELIFTDDLPMEDVDNKKATTISNQDRSTLPKNH